MSVKAKNGSVGVRCRSVASIAFGVVLLVYGALHMARGVRGPGPADGHYAFLLARSLAFDGDLDFRNDYAACGDPYAQAVDRGTGRLDNPGYIGPALVWVPLLTLARAMPLGVEATARHRAACDGPRAHFALAAAIPLGALAMALAYRAARRFASAGAALTATLLFAFASNLPQYAAIFTSSSHVFEAAAAALVVWLSLRVGEHPSLARSAWVAAALFALTLQRLPDAAFVVAPVVVLLRTELTARRRIITIVVIACGALAAVGVTLAYYNYLYGSPWRFPQGRHFLHLAHAHPFLLLFAPHGGLLYATPIAYLPLASLVLALTRRGPHRGLAFGAALIVAAVIPFAAAALDWHAKATYGARRLVVLVPLFVVLAAPLLDELARRIARRRLPPPLLFGGAAVLGFGVPSTLAMAGTTTGTTPLDDPGGRRWGLPYRVVAAIGDQAVWPAKLAFAARFRLPPSSLGAALTDRYYRRSYRDLTFEPKSFELTDPALLSASRGLAADPAGLVLVGRDGRFAFTAGWPFADTLSLAVRAPAAGTLRVDLERPFGRCTLEASPLAAGEQTATFAIPARCFDSGLLVLSVTGPPGLLLRTVQLDDTRALPPPF